MCGVWRAVLAVADTGKGRFVSGWGALRGRAVEVAEIQGFNETGMLKIEHPSLGICLKIRRLCGTGGNYSFSQRTG